jgi:hypothetical protein
MSVNLTQIGFELNDTLIRHKPVESSLKVRAAFLNWTFIDFTTDSHTSSKFGADGTK